MLTLHWTRNASDGNLLHFFSYRFADPFNATTASAIYKRLYAHLALDELPDAAMTEVLEYIGNAWLFHQPTSAAPESEQPARTLKGKLTRRYERPTYTVEE